MSGSMVALPALLLLHAGFPLPFTTSSTITGVYSNEEEVYFDGEAGNKPAPKITAKITDGKVEYLDDFGTPATVVADTSVVSLTQDSVTLKVGDRETVLRRANMVSCWAAVRKDQDKTDGSPDWVFERKLTLHDQGGRTKFGGGETGAPETILRMRRVTWPKGSSNRPSLVLYVHKPEAPSSAVSYSWADAGASRIGINLRWMQASCTIEGAERASEVSSSNFRG